MPLTPSEAMHDAAPIVAGAARGVAIVAASGSGRGVSEGVRDVLSALFDHCEGLLELRALPSATRIFVEPTDTAAIGAFALEHRRENVFFGVATRRNASSGTLENCGHVGAIFVDLDCHGSAQELADAEARLATFPLRPSLIIRSGGGLHAYWLLREPVDVQAEATGLCAVLRQLAQALVGDVASAECARILRLPGTLNHKYDPPASVSIHTFKPDWRVNLSDFEFLPSESANVSALPAAVLDLSAIAVGERNTTLYRLGRSLKSKSLPAQAVAEALRATNETCRPPLGLRELGAIIRQVTTQPDRPNFRSAVADPGGRSPIRVPPTPFPRTDDTQTVPTFALTDSGNADYFEHEMDHRLAYDHTAKQWFEFDGHHWGFDAVQHVIERAVEAMRQRGRDADPVDSDLRKAIIKHAVKSEERRRIVDLLALAQAKPTIAVDGSRWDANPLFFGVQNGVIDLETGRFRSGVASDFITKVSPVVYDPHARCPRFQQFLREIFADTLDVVEYMQRCLGYCMTGLTNEQVFWILWGLGANGKSTLMEVLDAVFGPYAWTMPFPTAAWTTTISEYQRAELPGRRFISASEVAQRGHLHEDFIKSLTGSDTVNARQPYGRPFTFVPVGKFWLRCNDRPIIKDLTHSMWRRVKMIPLTQTFAVDPTLTTTLIAEAPGILNWLLEGCRLWRAEGLCEPSSVQAATSEYRAASDVLTDFTGDCCHVAAGVSVGGRELYAAYQAWEHRHGTTPDQRLSQKTFGLRIKARFSDIGTARKTRYSGIALLTEAEL